LNHFKKKDIVEAYEVLKDEEKRGRYDNGEDLNDPNSQQGSPFHGGGFNFQGFQGFQGFGDNVRFEFN
jgi:DnaJ-class molecular chaperone